MASIFRLIYITKRFDDTVSSIEIHEFAVCLWTNIEPNMAIMCGQYNPLMSSDSADEGKPV